ncbi:hypothetical protein Tco_1192064 [Tanacetum coccineum]
MIIAITNKLKLGFIKQRENHSAHRNELLKLHPDLASNIVHEDEVSKSPLNIFWYQLEHSNSSKRFPPDHKPSIILQALPECPALNISPSPLNDCLVLVLD